jgi:hypothetical protein
MTLHDKYCEACGEEYTEVHYKLCKPCYLNNLKNNFTNWTSGNEKIDKFIQKMQLKIDNFIDDMFEWIPYSQFINVKEIEKKDSLIMYSAIWKDGPLYDDFDNGKLIRKSKRVTLFKLNCLDRPQDMIDKFLNKVRDFYI